MISNSEAVTGKAQAFGASTATPYLPSGEVDRHGDHCSCQLLSMAVLGRKDGCSYHFCRKVLQARWLMRCNHGRTPLLPEPELFYEPVLHIDGSMELAARAHEEPGFDLSGASPAGGVLQRELELLE